MKFIIRERDASNVLSRTFHPSICDDMHSNRKRSPLYNNHQPVSLTCYFVCVAMIVDWRPLELVARVLYVHVCWLLYCVHMKLSGAPLIGRTQRPHQIDVHLIDKWFLNLLDLADRHLNRTTTIIHSISDVFLYPVLMKRRAQSKYCCIEQSNEYEKTRTEMSERTIIIEIGFGCKICWCWWSLFILLLIFLYRSCSHDEISDLVTTLDWANLSCNK